MSPATWENIPLIDESTLELADEALEVNQDEYPQPR